MTESGSGHVLAMAMGSQGQYRPPGSDPPPQRHRLVIRGSLSNGSHASAKSVKELIARVPAPPQLRALQSA